MTKEELQELVKKFMDEIPEDVDIFVQLLMPNSKDDNVLNAGRGCPGCALEQIIISAMSGNMNHTGMEVHKTVM
jgi:hypothetical protein